MRPAPKHFSHDGYDFDEIWRRGAIAIYTQKRPAATEPTAWEVVILREGRAHPKDANQESIERYPSSEAWGVRGWTCVTLDKAKEKARLLEGKNTRAG